MYRGVTPVGHSNLKTYRTCKGLKYFKVVFDWLTLVANLNGTTLVGGKISKIVVRNFTKKRHLLSIKS